METFFEQLNNKLKIRGFEVSDTFWGSDDEDFNNPPMVTFSTDNENDRSQAMSKLKSILDSFYSKNQNEPENKLKITPMDGSGRKDSPRYGFILHSGKMEDLEESETPLKTQIQNYRDELSKFSNFLK